MDEQDLGDWDELFLEAVIQVEERNISSQLPPPYAPPIVPIPPAPEMSTISSSLSHAVQLQYSTGQRKTIPVRDPFISYSPPRVLSQRVCGFNDEVMDYSNYLAPPTQISPPTTTTTTSSRRCDSEKDLEISLLKEELGRVSKQLLDLEQERAQLGKGKSKETQLKNLCVKNKGQCSTVNASKRTNLEPDVATSSENHRGVDSTTGLNDKRSFKTTGVQADLASHHTDLSKKLLDIWCTSNYQDPRRNLISELLLACSTDLQILFSFMKISVPNQDIDKEEAKASSNMKSSNALESAKVYDLYSAVTKMSYGFVNMKTLVEPLLALSRAESAVLVHRSLHVLRVLLEHISGVEERFEARDNITDDEANSCEIAKFNGYNGRRKTNSSLGESSRKSKGGTDNAQPSWDANWHSLFELMNQIASRRTEEDVKLEAISIMNIIVMRTDPFTERETFVSKEVFESISLLLRKESGLHVRKEAIHLFYSLLNCPKLLARFDSLYEEKKSPASGNDSEGNLFALEAFGMIFEGLADCLTTPRKTSEDLELCRNVILILALVASSGNSGYELLSSHKLPNDTNFLMLVLHLLVAEIDSESTEFHPKAEIFKARTQLMREILILLNRLVSGISSSATILRELTKSRDMASLTVDVATRLSRKRNLPGRPESSVQRMRDSEITDLARIFKRRVFTYLGDNTS